MKNNDLINVPFVVYESTIKKLTKIIIVLACLLCIETLAYIAYSIIPIPSESTETEVVSDGGNANYNTGEGNIINE